MLLHGEIPDVRAVTHLHLDHRVDEVIGVGRRAEPVEHRHLGRLAGDHQRVREARVAIALAPVEHDYRVLHYDTVGHRDDRPTCEEGVVQERECVLAACLRHSEVLPSEPAGPARREVAEVDALGLERRVQLVVHHTAVAHHDHPRTGSRLGGPWAASRRTLVARHADLLGGHRSVSGKVELGDAAVAPDLLGRCRPGDSLEALQRGETASLEPGRARELP
ncbi:MAG: hypothetical protein M5T61_08840 [Acidimicrobiia bacterium]|nr:hypothetical protein [Acidimicrobiia bacterium]